MPRAIDSVTALFDALANFDHAAIAAVIHEDLRFEKPYEPGPPVLDKVGLLPRIPHGSPTGRLTRVPIEGNPTIHVDLGIDGVLPGVEATAARVVNSIPALCAADPGVYSALELVPRAIGTRQR